MYIGHSGLHEGITVSFLFSLSSNIQMEKGYNRAITDRGDTVRFMGGGDQQVYTINLLFKSNKAWPLKKFFLREVSMLH